MGWYDDGEGSQKVARAARANTDIRQIGCACINKPCAGKSCTRLKAENIELRKKIKQLKIGGTND